MDLSPEHNDDNGVNFLKYILLIFLIIALSKNCHAQDKIKQFYFKNDLAFDYYRGTMISGGTSLMLNKVTKKPILSGIAGLIIGTAQGLIFERGQSGKTISCMGSVSGSFVYIIDLHLKECKRLEKLELEKYKYNFNEKTY